jgi:hypothetical protein
MRPCRLFEHELPRWRPFHSPAHPGCLWYRRRLDVAPSPAILAALSRDTGVAVAFMRENMTFRRLARELVPTVLASTPLCRRCVVEAEAAGRKVELLRWLSPWRFAWDRHPPPISPEEMDWGLDHGTMLRDVGLFSERLEAAAFGEPSYPFPPIGRSTADCIRLVRALNDRIRFHVHDRRGGKPVFEIQGIPSEPDDVIAAAQRNRRVVSAWYAWHLLRDPEGALRRHTRSATLDGARMLAVLLAGFLPGEQMIVARRHVMAQLGVAVRGRARWSGEYGAAQQTDARHARGPPRRSPFEYPDFGRRFVSAFYLPGALLVARCKAAPLRASVRPPASPPRRTPRPAPSRPRPPEALAPYSAIVAAARAELAREAGGGPVRPRDLARRAFQLLRRGDRSIFTATIWVEAYCLIH